MDFHLLESSFHYHRNRSSGAVTISITSITANTGYGQNPPLIAYALLFFPIALHQPKYWVGIGLVIITLSGAIELIQPWVNRYGEWLDLLANTVGVVLGGCAGAVGRLIFMKNMQD